MKTKYGLITLLALVLVVANLMADISWSGDARVRPRLDQVFKNGDKASQDLYYMIRARVNMTATLTDGYYATIRLGADGYGEHLGKFGYSKAPVSAITGVNFDDSTTTSANAVADDRWATPYFGFTMFEFGRKTDNWGYAMGRMAAGALGNPIYDLHFYPGKQSDIPFLIYDIDRVEGFKFWYNVAGNPVTVMYYINVENVEWKPDTETPDHTTIDIKYDLKLGGMKLSPQLIKTMTDDGIYSPLSLGAGLAGLPLGLSFNAYYLMNANAEVSNDVENGYLARIKASKKIGPGSFIAWFDYSAINYQDVDDAKNTLNGWITYAYNIYKSDMGSFAVKPTWRFTNQKQGETLDYHRSKIELTFDFTFK